MNPRILRISSFIILLACLAMAGFAAETTSQETGFLKAFFQSPKLDHGSLFHPSFLKAVPPAKIDEIRDMYVKNTGEWREAIGANGQYELIFSKGKAPCKLHLDEKGLVNMLWFGQWVLTDDTPEKILTEFKALPGSTALTLDRDGSRQILDYNGDRPLAIGSSFKLSILKALAKAMADGKYKPETIVPLRKDWRSLPSGMLQNWPASTPVTIQTLANLMISISDNTATDHLLFLLGREAVEAMAPDRVRPFMATMEMFRVKYGDEKRAEAFATLDPQQRLAALSAMATETVDLEKIRTTPFLVDSVEWFYTTRELAALLYELRGQSALSINPGLVDPRQWHDVRFKGGSEPGVLNYTILLQKAPGSATYCLSASINDSRKAVDTKGFNGLIERFIQLIASGSFDAVKP